MIISLSPVDNKSPDWDTSTYRGPAVVRALDEWTARLAACMAFGVARPAEQATEPGDATAKDGISTVQFIDADIDDAVADRSRSPWLNRRLVIADIVLGDEFPPDGPFGVVSPEGYGGR